MRRQAELSRLDGLAAAERGLTSSEAAERRARYGTNDIIEEPAGGTGELIRETAKDPMIWFVVGAGVLMGLLGNAAEAVVLFGAVFPLAFMDAFLHRRTQASTAGLKSRLAARATVFRDGAARAIRANEVVPGDLAVVAAGEPFPADGLLIGGDELQVDESILTGEAFPVAKKALSALPASREAVIEGAHWGFAGTRLLTGKARLRIIYTGGETLYGEIVRSAVGDKRARTPLQEAIRNLVRILLAAAAVFCVILVWVRLRQGFGVLDALLSAATLGVAAIPEEFPVALTFFLGAGVYRLAKRQALVRRAVAVENIGRVTSICCDKTGTLTEGRVRLAHTLPAASVSRADLIETAVLASRRESNDPLDAALLDEAPEQITPRAPVAVFPFTEDRRRETAILRDRPGVLLAATKGAPETILAACQLAPTERKTWEARIADLAASAHKVIGCARRELSEAEWPGGEPDHGFVFAGLLACEDPVRIGVPEAVRLSREAGIRVIIVTGDHPTTAVAVAREVGIGGDAPVVVEADKLEERLSGEEASAVLRNVDVVARAIPAQKLWLVKALQAKGEIVAVTGDGVNDVPALQAADVGIAMGERGTRSAREVAAIVLLDDNLRTIVNAVMEGRQLFRNLKLSFAYLLMIHVPLVVSAALIPIAGYPLLYLPVHIVWLELIIHPTALLVFLDLPAGRFVTRSEGKRFFSAREWMVIALVGAIVTAVVVLGYERSLGVGRNVEHARAMALVALVVASATMTAGLSRLRQWTARIVVLATLASALVLIQMPALAALLHVTPLHFDDWLIAASGGVLAGALSYMIHYPFRHRTAAQ